MVAQVKQLKTHRTQQKERMVEYLEKLLNDVKSDKVLTLIAIADKIDEVETEVIGDITCMETIGMLDTAKLGYQFAMMEDDGCHE